MAKSRLDGKTILITGGTGSFGNRFVRRLLDGHKPAKIIVFSRDELKQSEMDARLSDPRVRFLLGDIRDPQRLQRAFHGVDIVVHAAALKQVPPLEYNPFEAVQTNIIGAENIINAAIDNKIARIVALSTDKAVNPVNLYGATKLCAEKLFVAGNSYVGWGKTRFAVVRYGNVVGSRGSVVPLFLQQRETGSVSVTDERMTRFWISLDGAVDVVLHALASMEGGEIFVPKIPSMKITDLAEAVAPGCAVRTIGIRPGEKLHEVLMSPDESARTVEAGKYYVINPSFRFWGDAKRSSGANGHKTLPKGFCYSSDSNDQWLKVHDLRKIVAELT